MPPRLQKRKDRDLERQRGKRNQKLPVSSQAMGGIKGKEPSPETEENDWETASENSDPDGRKENKEKNLSALANKNDRKSNKNERKSGDSSRVPPNSVGMRDDAATQNYSKSESANPQTGTNHVKSNDKKNANRNDKSNKNNLNNTRISKNESGAGDAIEGKSTSSGSSGNGNQGRQSSQQQQVQIGVSLQQQQALVDGNNKSKPKPEKLNPLEGIDLNNYASK